MTVRVQTKVPDRIGTRVLELGLEQANVVRIIRLGEQGHGVVVGSVLSAVLVRQVATEAAGLVAEELAGGDEAVGAVGTAEGRG